MNNCSSGAHSFQTNFSQHLPVSDSVMQNVTELPHTSHTEQGGTGVLWRTHLASLTWFPEYGEDPTKPVSIVARERCTNKLEVVDTKYETCPGCGSSQSKTKTVTVQCDAHGEPVIRLDVYE